ncbi:type II secretion system F family protein [Janibacter melonis]|uniref:type II secretion system F family protein n=1 Tax=Janibacter melonis TaxID=262209 RepID=UPI002044B6D7|nr:type II secretion system F family protein [Janibacter melonis]MCM3556410.1 type II secretion system F family protein [Janibacter melonis]
MTPALVALVLAAALVWPPRARAAPGPLRPGDDAPSPLLSQVADATDLLALSLVAGRGITEALDAVADVSDPAVALDLRRVGAALRWGREMRAAWSYASPGWGPVATALVVSSECGAPASEVLAGAAARIREGEARRLEAAAARAGVLLVVPLGLFFLPAFVAMAVVPMLLVLLGQSLR